jgi:hypothetical protein
MLGQCSEDRKRRIPELATPRCPKLGVPRGDRFVGEPHRQAAALAQAGIVGRPAAVLNPVPPVVFRVDHRYPHELIV